MKSDAPVSRNERRKAAILKLLLQANAALLDMREDGDPVLLDAGGQQLMKVPSSLADELLRQGLIEASSPSRFRASEEGRAWLSRRRHDDLAFRAQHGALSRQIIDEGNDKRQLWRNDAESPLAWLRARRGKDGRPLIEDAQYAAGERLRADVTRGQMMARTTANWQTSLAGGRRAGQANDFTDATLAARERVRRALAMVGPELSGVLLDVCCFLKPMEQVESEHLWPPRSGRIVLGLALHCLARHYGLQSAAVGQERQGIRAWHNQAPMPAGD